jgi:hypothetical protein
MRPVHRLDSRLVFPRRATVPVYNWDSHYRGGSTMKPISLALALIMLAAWHSAAFAGDWYIHRTSEQMKEPPYYCYCYSRSKANVLAGKVTYPVEMQITEEQVISKLAVYAALSETCPNNCGAGPGRGTADDPPLPPKLHHEPAPECKQLAQVGGCSGFCRGMAAGYEEKLADTIAKCVSDCLQKYRCSQ